MKGFCEKCNKWLEGIPSKELDDYKVLDDIIRAETDILVCPKCGSIMYCEDVFNKSLHYLFNIYRKKHNLLFPEDIKAIREKYGLSQRALSRLLNWGDKTVHRYEQGSLQDKPHNSMLMFINNPLNLKEYLMHNETKLEPRELAKLKARVDDMTSNALHAYNEEYLIRTVTALLPFDHENVQFAYDRFYNTVLLFAIKFRESSRHLYKVVLMKILFYADMVNYKLNNCSLTGLPYIHMQYGPVPYDYDILLEWLNRDNLAKIKTKYKDQYEYHEIIPLSGVDIDVFTHDEIKVIESVYEAFKDFGSKEIAEYSHKEKAYTETKPGDFIPYSYAKNIELPSNAD